MNDQTIYILVVQHRHGHDISAHKTNAGAIQALYHYIMAWWHELETTDGDPVQLPTNPIEATALYFEHMPNEDYDIHVTTLQP